jgi:flagellar basal body P-ring formation protein FlgA
MRLFRFLAFFAGAGFLFATARAAEPVTITLNERATVGTAVVTVGDVALITGGDAATRARIGRIDLAELKTRQQNVAVDRKSVEYRLLLAGFDAAAVRVAGAESTNVALSRRSVTVEEVTAVARTEALRLCPNPEAMVVELAVPIVVKLPEVPANDKVAITAKPRGKPGPTGRVQMDVTIAGSGGEQLLSLAVHLTVQQGGKPAIAPAGGINPLPPIPMVPVAPVTPAAGTAFASNEILVQARQRVEIQVNTGGIKASAVGEAQQPGKLGQTILVQNVDSKKTISARVTGPATVEVDLGGSR